MRMNLLVSRKMDSFWDETAMRAGSRISDLKYKLMTIELLNLAKNYSPYGIIQVRLGPSQKFE